MVEGIFARDAKRGPNRPSAASEARPAPPQPRDRTPRRVKTRPRKRLLSQVLFHVKGELHHALEELPFRGAGKVRKHDLLGVESGDIAELGGVLT